MPGKKVVKRDLTIAPPITPTSASELMERRREALFGKGRSAREDRVGNIQVRTHPMKPGQRSGGAVRRNRDL